MPLTIDPRAITLINQAFSECEHRLQTSPTITKAEALILPRQTELSALVTTSSTFPARVTAGDAAISIGYLASDDAYIFEIAAPSWAMGITLTALPGELVDGRYEVWQTDGNQSQHVTWEYEGVTVQIGERTAPDDHPIYSEQQLLKFYQCQAADIRAEYHESIDQLWTGDLSHSKRYLANIDGEKVTLSAGKDLLRFVVKTCIDDDCRSSTGNDWSERQKELPAMELREKIIPDYVLDLLQDSR